jgi:hypothetical protein
LPLADAFTTFVHETPTAPAVDDETAGAGGVGAGVDVDDVLDEGLGEQSVVFTLERGMPLGTDRGVSTFVQLPDALEVLELCADATLGKNIFAKTARAAEQQSKAIARWVLLNTGILLRADAQRHGARQRGIARETSDAERQRERRSSTRSCCASVIAGWQTHPSSIGEEQFNVLV